MNLQRSKTKPKKGTIAKIKETIHGSGKEIPILGTNEPMNEKIDFMTNAYILYSNLIEVNMFVKITSEDLNFSPCSSHLTSAYSRRVSIALMICGGCVMKVI